jgi:hypothetical protein
VADPFALFVLMSTKTMQILLLRTVLVIFILGCSGSYDYPGPKINKFDGRLTSEGEPVQFVPDQKVVLRLVFHENGESYGIPIKPDGSFNIGWMPIGKYSARLEYSQPPKADNSRDGSNRPRQHAVPGGFEVVEGQTEYAIELGKDWNK